MSTTKFVPKWYVVVVVVAAAAAAEMEQDMRRRRVVTRREGVVLHILFVLPKKKIGRSTAWRLTCCVVRLICAVREAVRDAKP